MFKFEENIRSEKRKGRTGEGNILRANIGSLILKGKAKIHRTTLTNPNVTTERNKTK